MASASAPAPAAGAGAGGGKDDELADLVRRLVDAVARYADRLPFDLDRQVRSRICDPCAVCFDRSCASLCGDLWGPGAQRWRLVRERLGFYLSRVGIALFPLRIVGSQASIW